MTKRLMAMLLAVAICTSCLPVTVFADNETPEETEIRQTLLKSVDEEQYPQGLFDFLTPRMETSEDVSEAEFAVVRRGNTDEAASVTFKAIDMTAKYGEDYTLQVSGKIFGKTLPENPESQPLIYDEATTDDEAALELLDESDEESGEESDGEADAESYSEMDSESDAEYADITQTANIGMDLRSARTALTGAESDYTNWRDADRETTEMLSEAYGEMYDEIEGVEYTLEFEPGEYMKKLKFITIDDKISEDEEQVLFVLSHPENGAVSENPTGFMNIKDNEEPEEITFGFSENTVTVDADSSKAELIIERRTGLYRYGTVTVSSAEYTAAEGVYYDGFATEIAFVPGQEYKRIEIPIKKHPAVEDVSFKVYIDGSSEAAVVNIEHGNIIGEKVSGDDIVAGGGSNDVQLMSNDVQLMAANDNIKRYVSYPDLHFKLSSNSYSTYETFYFDMSMVEKIEFESYDQCDGTYKTYKKNFFYKTKKWWERGSTCSVCSLYAPSPVPWASAFSLKTIWEETKKHNWTSVSYKLEKDDRANYTGLRFELKTGGGCENADAQFRNIKVYYLPIEIRIDAYDDDAMIQKKIYTSPTQSKDDGNKFKAGGLKFKGEDASVKSKVFYNNDIVSFEETDRQEKDGTYLWGIKFETKGGATNKFFYYKGDSFSISDLYNGKLKDIKGDTIGYTAQLNDTINGEDITCYRVYPVYKQKTAYTTINIDENKSMFATGTFSNNQTIKTGLLDKIQISIAGKDEWAVSGFNLGYGNRDGLDKTTVDIERSMFSENWGDGEYEKYLSECKKNSNWTTTLANTDAATPGDYLFSPLKSDNFLEASYQEPGITVVVNPRASNGGPTSTEPPQEQGFVAYVDDNGSEQVARYTGTDSKGLLRGEEIKISPYKTNTAYQLIGGFYDENKTSYKFQWQDFTGDKDHDGDLTDEEIRALGNAYNEINRGVYAGDIFNFVPNVMSSPIIYYHIIPKSQKNMDIKNKLSGNVLLQTCSVIENSKPKPSVKTSPIADAAITAGGYTVLTDENGKWIIEAGEFDAGETYTATLVYGGRSYTGDATVNRAAIDYIVDEYNTFNVYDFNAYQVINESEYENVEDWKLHSISNSLIENEDKRHLYTFKIDQLIPTTATVGRIEIERHSSDGALKKTYTAVYNADSDVYEIKDPALIEKYKDNPKAYNYSFNPATESVAAGDYLTLRIFDQYDVGYIKHNIGFAYKPKLSVLSIVNSFKSPLNPVLEYLGKIDTDFDLGLSARLDDFVGKHLNDKTDEDGRTISYGWSKDFKKSYDSNKKNDEDKDKDKDKAKKDSESSEAPNTAAETIKEEAKNLENASDESGKDSEVKQEAADTAKEAVDTKDEDNKKSSSITSELKLTLSVALELVMGYDAEANKYYFKDFVVTGVVSSTSGATYEYATPIGITIFIKGELTGDITAMMAIEPYYRNPAEPNYLYMGDTGSIDLTNMGNSDVNRQLTIYGKLMIRPKVTLSVGGKLISDKIASVSLSGSAAFDMVFTTALDGAGKVTLSAELALSILNGLIKKKWLLANKSYDLFSINGGTLASLMAVNEDYRYDIITPEDTDEMLYLENRSGWNGAADSVSLMATGTERYNEHTLQTGAYPYAYPQIFTIDAGTQYNGSDTKQILIFLDKNENSAEHETELKYSIYNGGIWSEPQVIDNDSTNVDTPNVTDLGDRLFITWSGEGEGLPSGNYVDRLNSRNLKAVFFDKVSETFGEITEITRTTEFDNYADHDVAAAYYEDADNRKLIVNYVKTAYDPTGEMSGSDAELTVGDILDAYTVVACRVYDFETEEWTDEYSQDYVEKLKDYGMTDEQIEVFQSTWYGQTMVDLSQYVSVDKSNLLIPEDDETIGQYAGLWSREPDSSEIYLETFQNDPRVVEHGAISCGEYAVSAYVIDLDKSNETTDDREIFLQMYAFKEDKFYPSIRLTNDAYNQSHITFADTPEGEMLYYVSNGNIVSINIGELTENLIKTTDNEGNPVLVRNKYYPMYSGESVVLEAEEDNPYSEFVVNTDDSNVYLTWTASSISFKDGVDRNSDEATLPENYYLERQMYMAMETFDIEDYTYTDEDNNPIYYPSTDDNGNIIDWSVTPDVNNEIGRVNAGDPIVEKLYTGKWTKPVQMTDEQGAHYSDIDCVMIGNGILRCVYLKGMSEITDVAGENMSVENTDNRALISADFDFNVERYTLSFNNAEDISAGRKEMPIGITVKNESLLTMPDVKVSLFMTKDGTSEPIAEKTVDEIPGGDSADVTLLWDVPDELEDVTLTAYVEQGGMEFASVSQTLDYDGLIEITDIYHEMLDRNTARFTVTVKNTGSENAKDENVYVNCGGVVSKSDEFDVVSGSTEIVTFEVQIPEEAFEESRDETTITETAQLRVYTNNSINDYNIVRSGSAKLEELMNKTIVLQDSTGAKTYTDKITMTVGDLLMLNSSIDGEGEVNYPRINIVSDNEEVISVINGVLTAENAGTAEIVAEAYPRIDTYTTNDSDYMRHSDTYITLPSCLIKTITLSAEVTGIAAPTNRPATGGGGGGWSAKATPTPLPAEGPDAADEATVEPSENNWFIDVPENEWYYNSVKYAFEKGLMIGVSDTEFAPDSEVTRAMFVTVLYRMENEPDMSNEIFVYPFEDVDAQSWYGSAVYWARTNGIVKGYSDMEFAPDDNITREQMAAIVYRYAEFKGCDTSISRELPYSDSISVSDYAREAVVWNTDNGILQGNEDNTFAPLDYTTRAQAAAVFERIVKNLK